jgi:major vault protein
LFKGPGTYIPRVEESVNKKVDALIVTQNYGILMRAVRKTVDAAGISRLPGETVS